VNAAPEEPYTGPRTLDGRPAPQAIPTVPSSSRTTRAPPRGGIATLGSLQQGGDSHGHDHDDDDDDDDDGDFNPDAEQPRDLFAGGEKSGLAVQDPKRDPRSVVNDLIKKAKA
jgi:UBX domain-containing protein 1